MTALDMDEATARSVAELMRRLRMILPPSLLADAEAFAAAFKRWEAAEGWYCRSRGDQRPPGSGTDPTPEFLAAKAALERKD